MVSASATRRPRLHDHSSRISRRECDSDCVDCPYFSAPYYLLYRCFLCNITCLSKIQVRVSIRFGALRQPIMLTLPLRWRPANFGPSSNKALAATVGPLMEAPVLLGLGYLRRHLRRQWRWEGSESPVLSQPEARPEMKLLCLGKRQ
jgi:hypothetical protein